MRLHGLLPTLQHAHEASVSRADAVVLRLFTHIDVLNGGIRIDHNLGLVTMPLPELPDHIRPVFHLAQLLRGYDRPEAAREFVLIIENTVIHE